VNKNIAKSYMGATFLTRTV